MMLANHVEFTREVFSQLTKPVAQILVHRVSLPVYSISENVWFKWKVGLDLLLQDSEGDFVLDDGAVVIAKDSEFSVQELVVKGAEEV